MVCAPLAAIVNPRVCACSDLHTGFLTENKSKLGLVCDLVFHHLTVQVLRLKESLNWYRDRKVGLSDAKYLHRFCMVASYLLSPVELHVGEEHIVDQASPSPSHRKSSDIRGMVASRRRTLRVLVPWFMFSRRVHSSKTGCATQLRAAFIRGPIVWAHAS